MILSLAVIGILLASLFTLCLWKVRHITLLSPIGLFSSCFTAVYFVMPVLQNHFGVGHWLYIQGSDVTDQISAGLVTSILYYLLAALAFSMANPPHIKTQFLKQAASSPGGNEKGLVLLLTVLGLASAAVSVYIFLPYLGSGRYATFMADRIAQGAGLGYLFTPILLIVPASLLLTAPTLASRPTLIGRPLFLALMLMTILALCSAITGNRLQGMIGFVYLAISGVLLRPRTIKVTHLFAIAIGILILVSMMGSVRQSITAGRFDTGEDVGASATLTFEQLMNEVSADFGQAELLSLAQAKMGEWEYAYGRTYLSGVLLPIPRAWWDDKPVGAGPMMANIIRPGSYDLQRKYSSSVTTGCVTEAYLNGGVVGVLLVGVLHGLLIGAVTKYGARVRFRYQYVAYLLAAMFAGEMLIYGEFVGVLGRAGSFIVPMVLYCRIRSAIKASGVLRCRLVPVQGPWVPSAELSRSRSTFRAG